MTKYNVKVDFEEIENTMVEVLRDDYASLLEEYLQQRDNMTKECRFDEMQLLLSIDRTLRYYTLAQDHNKWLSSLR